MSLRHKPIHELRGMAQAFDVPDIFQKDAIQLAQAIELKQQAMATPVVQVPERNPYDARLMLQRPKKITKPDEILAVLKPFMDVGLRVRHDEESWYMDIGKLNDSGSLRMPLRDVVLCAERLMRATK